MERQEIKDMITKLNEDMKESMKTIATETIAEVLKSSDSRLERTTKKFERKRKADQISFNKKGHEDQHNHGKDVEEKIDDALECLEDNNINGAKEKLEQGKQLIKQRAKFLRIADRDGWLTVQQFRCDDLASDEEEEKKLKRAIKSASTLKDKLIYNNKKSKTEYKDFYSADKKSSSYYTQSDNYKRKLDDIVCYNCRRIGHYANHCPFERDSQRELPKLPYVERKSDYRRDRRERHH